MSNSILNIRTDSDPWQTYADLTRFLDQFWIECPELSRFKLVYRLEPWTDAIKMDLVEGGEIELDQARVPTLPLSMMLGFALLHARMANEDAEFYFEEDARYVIRNCGTEIERLSIN